MTQSDPLDGNDQFDVDFDLQRADVHILLQQARATRPVFYSPTDDVWYVTRYDDVVSVLLDPATYSSKHIFGESGSAEKLVSHILTSDPPEHTRLRNLVSEAMTPRWVATLEPMITKTANDLIEALGSGPADVMATFAYRFPLTIILQILGVPAEDLEMCRTWSQDRLTLITTRQGGSLSESQRLKAVEGARAQDEYLRQLIADRAEHPIDGNDLITELLAISGPDGLTQAEFVTLVAGLITAGHENTASLLGNAILLLIRHSDVLKAVQQDHGMIPTVVEETLRYASVAGMPRTTTRPVDIGGTAIPAGARVMPLFMSANRDESHYSDGADFRPRPGRESSHLSFGRGIHYCSGAGLARLESKIAMEQILSRLPALRLAGEPIFHTEPGSLGNLRVLPIAWS